MNGPSMPTGYYDWEGQAVLLEDIANGRTFEQLAGLDPLKWAVVAVDLTTGTVPGARTGLVLFAIDLTAFGVTDFAGRQQVLTDARSRGSVNLTQIVREDIGISEVIAQMKTARVQFRANGFRDSEFEVTAHHAGSSG